MTAPNPKLQIDVSGSAWNGTRTYTDVSSYVRWATDPATVIWGRLNERATLEPSVLTVTLDNADGRFTPGRASSPYYPYFKRGTPIYLPVEPTPGDVPGHPRFYGFIDTIEQTIRGSWSQVTVTAADVLAKVRARRPLASIATEHILSLDPDGYWPFKAGIGRTDITGGSRSAIVVRGKNRSGDSSVGYSLAGADALAGDPAAYLTFEAFFNFVNNDTGYLLRLGREVHLGGWTWLAWVNSANSTENYNSNFFSQSDTAGIDQVQIYCSALLGGGFTVGTTIRNSDDTVAVATAATTDVTDAEWHLIAVTLGTDDKTLKIYVDGALEATATAGSAVSWKGSVRPDVGGHMPRSFETGGQFYDGSIGHVAIFDRVLTASDLTDVYSAGASFAGDTTTDLAVRVCDYVGLTQALTTTPDDHVVGPIATEGMTVFDLLMVLAATADRPIYQAPATIGALKWADIQYDETVDVTIPADDTTGEGQFQHDSQLQFNTVTVNYPGGSEVYRRTASVTADGPMETSVDAASETAARAYELASWIANTHKDPATRSASLPVDLLTGSVDADTLLAAAHPGGVWSLTSLSSLAPATTMTGRFEGCTETIGTRAWVLDFHTQPLVSDVLGDVVGLVGTNSSDSTLIDDALVGY